MQVLSPVRKPEVIEPPERPPTILYDWCMLPNGRLYGEYVENHPTIGNGPNCYTSRVLFIDEVLGIARTRNTNYILRRKSK